MEVPTSVDYNKVNDQLQKMADGDNLQELARYALSAGSVLNRKSKIKRFARSVGSRQNEEENSDVR